MTAGATKGLEKTLRVMSIEDRSSDPHDYRSVMRCKDELRSIIHDQNYWRRLRTPEVKDAAAAGGVDRHRLEAALEDKLAEVIFRTGYQESPEAIELIRTSRELAREADDPQLPKATREDLVGTYRTALIKLHNKLHQKLQPPPRAEGDDAEPNIPPDAAYEASYIVRRAKPGLVGMVVLDEVTSSKQDPPAFRLHVTNASISLVTEWLSCLDATPADR